MNVDYKLNAIIIDGKKYKNWAMWAEQPKEGWRLIIDIEKGPTISFPFTVAYDIFHGIEEDVRKELLEQYPKLAILFKKED